MKIIAHILIILMATMAAIPCADAADTCEIQLEQSGQVSLENHNAGDGIDIHHDDCSPLCPCQCCPSIDSEVPEIPEFTRATPSPINAHEMSKLFSLHPEVIWSPPQLIS